jgi:hypothetical protein
MCSFVFLCSQNGSTNEPCLYRQLNTRTRRSLLTKTMSRQISSCLQTREDLTWNFSAPSSSPFILIFWNNYHRKVYMDTIHACSKTKIWSLQCLCVFSVRKSTHIFSRQLDMCITQKPRTMRWQAGESGRAWIQTRKYLIQPLPCTVLFSL